MLDQSWSLLGDCTEMAVASDDVRFLMLEISERRRGMSINRNTLVFDGSAMHEGFLFRAICTMEL